MTNEELIGELIDAHLQVIHAATKGAVHDQAAFDSWAAQVAKLHASITIKVLLNDQDTTTTTTTPPAGSQLD